MADELDAMLAGQDQASSSQTQSAGQGNDSTQTQSLEQQTPEEIEFNSLGGSAQERFKRIVREKRELQERLSNLERLAGSGQVPPAPNSQFQTPDMQAALQTLERAGVTTDDKLQRVLDERLNVLRWEQEQARLETKYNGSRKIEGIQEPQYVREEVEEYISSHPQYRGYSPEDVFRDHMFRNEFSTLESMNRSNATTRTGQTATLRPTRAQVQNETLTPEYIADRTDIKKYPDALEWQEAHRTEIDKVLSQMQA